MPSTTKQKLVLFVCVAGNFLAAAVYSLQAPFFPAEAEKKGVVPSEYGLVFGIYELTILLVAPLIGANLTRLGSKFCTCAGLYVVGSTCALFGALNMINDRFHFLILAYTIRIMEGLGQCAYSVSTLATLSVVYPDTANAKMSMITGAFTLGMIASPTLGGVLYSFGGFGLPFYMVGGVLLMGATISVFIMPVVQTKPHRKGGKTTVVLLKNGNIWLAMLCLFATATSIGFVEATLEPHIRVFKFAPIFVSLFFIVSPAIQTVAMRVTGSLMDKGTAPRRIMVCGCVMMIAAFSLMGPFPWINTSPKPILVIAGLLCCGIGIACQITPGFGEMLRVAQEMGLPQNEETNGVVSGLWQVCTSVGIFMGPFVGGIMLQYVGFRKGALVPISVNAVLLIILIFLLWKSKEEKEQEKTRLRTVSFQYVTYDDVEKVVHEKHPLMNGFNN